MMNTGHSKLLPRTLVAICGVLVATAPGFVQAQESRQDSQRPAERSTQGEGARERPRFEGSRLRESLKKTIEDMKKAQQDAEASLAQLEKGTAPVEVARDMSPELRQFLRENLPGQQAGAMGGPLGGPLGGQMGGQMGGPGNGPGLRGRMNDRKDGMRGGRDGPMDGPDDGPNAGGPDGRRAMGLEARREVLRQLREQAPDIADGLESLRRDDERMAEGFASRVAPRLREAMMLRERDPEVARMKIDELRSGFGVLRAIREYRQAKNLPEDNADMIAARQERLTRAESDLRNAVGAALNVRLKAHERELTMLERRVEDVRKDLDEKRAKKDEGVDQLVERIKKGDMPQGLFGSERPDRPDGQRGPMRDRDADDRPNNRPQGRPERPDGPR